MLTAYDYTFASILDAAAIDIILVGDSLSNVFQGNETTLPVTLEEMIYHGKAVMKAVKQAFVVIDLPFGTYQVNDSEALKNAIQLLKTTNAQAVKLEGGQEIANTISKMVQAGIPVMGHLGLTPQSIHQLGSYELQATSQAAKDKIKEEWTKHNNKIADSHEIWFGVMGPDTPVRGELKTEMQLYQQQFAQTFAKLMGYTFKADHPIAGEIFYVFKMKK